MWTDRHVSSIFVCLMRRTRINYEDGQTTCHVTVTTEEFKTVSDQILPGKYFHFIPEVSCIRGVNFVAILYSQRRVHFVEKDVQ
jgi:hypothetical protein